MEGGAKYFGERHLAGCSVYVKHGSKWFPLRQQISATKDSPVDFDWGYMCTGSARLALAILIDHLKNEARALECFENFEFKVVARLNRNEWLLSGEEIDEALRDIEHTFTAAA